MIHVCFGLNDPSGFNSKFVGTAMLSIFENISKPTPSVTVHILHDNTLTPDNRDKFNNLAGRYNQLVKFYNVEDAEKFCASKIEEMSNLFPKINKNALNKNLFYKFFVPQVLPANIDKAIFFDGKIVVNMDVSRLCLELGDKMLGLFPVTDTTSNVQNNKTADGSAKPDDYFNSTVMLMNLNVLRTQKEYFNSSLLLINLKLSRNQSQPVKTGVNEQKYFELLEQTVWNQCFAQQVVKLSEQLNKFVGWARRDKEPVAKNIYNYAANALQLDTTEPFNRLWLDYFAKTPWFTLETIGRLYNGFRQSYAQINDTMKLSVRNISAIMSGKTRVFFTLSNNVEMIKKNFSVRDDEEIILAQGQDAIKTLLDAMRKGARKKMFFIVIPQFPFAILNNAGFVFGRDFLNGWEFLSTSDSLPALNSYPLINAM